MQLFKERNFSALFNDSFKFIKLNFKHFYGGFFKIVGIPALIFIILCFAIFKIVESQMLNSISFSDFRFLGGPYLVYIILLGFLLFLVLLVLGIITQLYSPTYFKKYESEGEHFDNNELWALLKSNIWKSIPYFLLTMLLAFVATSILILLIVGFGLLFNDITFMMVFGVIIFVLLMMSLIIFIPYIMMGIQIGLYEYLNKELGIFNAIKQGFATTNRKFWPHVGGFFLYSLLINMVIGLVVNIPFYILMFSQMIFGIDPTANDEFIQGFFSMYFWQYVIQILVNLLSSPILQVYSLLVFYSNQDEQLQNNIYQELDEIGR